MTNGMLLLSIATTFNIQPVLKSTHLHTHTYMHTHIRLNHNPHYTGNRVFMLGESQYEIQTLHHTVKKSHFSRVHTNRYHMMSIKRMFSIAKGSMNFFMM